MNNMVNCVLAFTQSTGEKKELALKILEDLAKLCRATFLKEMSDVSANQNYCVSVRNVAVEQLKKNLSINGSEQTCSETVLEAIGYVCRNSSVQEFKNDISDLIVAELSSSIQNPCVRLAGLKALFQCLKYLKPTFRSVARMKKFSEVLCRQTTDSNDILEAIVDCHERLYSIRIEYAELKEASGSNATRKRSRDDTNLSDKQSKPPTLRNSSDGDASLSSIPEVIPLTRDVQISSDADKQLTPRSSDTDSSTIPEVVPLTPATPAVQIDSDDQQSMVMSSTATKKSPARSKINIEKIAEKNKSRNTSTIF